jgi:asparagine synthase (glutamine-hydrolysing)
MCGLAGWVASRTVDEAILRRMTDALIHRGPDADGFYVSPDRRVGLGHRRLSIIDLATGDQPISNEDGTIWVIFNGEIYNFPDLRDDLERAGHRFATNSDTEVIVHAYEHYGEDCVHRLNGMFAFALYDQPAQRVFLARDRFGEKPLHYAVVDGDFLFGSEIKALLAHPGVSRTVDLRAFARYLVYEYVPSPSSIFREIRKLPPAHRMTYDVRSGAIHLSRYWDLEFRPDPTRPEGDAAAELYQRLRGAVQRRLMSEVPLGVLLSGGIDSSAVLALMAEVVPARRIKTFNIAFTDKSFDESGFARDVARRFGTEHHEHVFDVREMVAVLPEVLAFLDEPLADASLLPTYLLSRFTRRSVTVALGGDGGDELLAGYPTFTASRYAQWFDRAPAAVRRVVERVAARLPTSTKNFSFDFKLRQFLKGMEYPEPRRTQVWLGSFSPSDLSDLLSEDVKAQLNGFDALEDLDLLLGAPVVANADWLDRLVYQHVNTYLADDILAKVDRASMACSLEVRAPFLDHTLAGFLGTLPSSFKLRGGRAKYLLKKSLAGRLSVGVLDRPKKGFGIPIAQWLKDELSALARETLGTEKLRKQGLFNPQRVQTLLEEHQAGSRNHRKPLWTLLMFQWWSERLGV